MKQGTKLLFFHEHSYGGITTVVSNIEEGIDTKTLLTNGKFQGDDSLQTEAQIAFTAIPTMHLARRQDALVIGFGTGHSAGMLLDYGFPAIDIADLSPGILRASDLHFKTLNKNILHDPRATVFLEDGRNVLLTRAKQYDLISIEVTSVRFAGATNIYSHEFYQLAKARLKPGGYLQQWIQLHHITPAQVGTILGTMRASFPHVNLWSFGGQGILVGSETPQVLEPTGQAAVYSSVRRQFGNKETKAVVFMKDLAGSELLDWKGVDRLLERKPRLNTDWNRRLEYSTPKNALSEEDWPSINLATLS